MGIGNEATEVVMLPCQPARRGRSSQSELVPGLEELELAEPVGVGVVEQVIPGQPTDDPRQHLGTGQLV